MMKVNYYFRNAAHGNFSIENVFRIIEESLSDRITSERFYTVKPFDLAASLRFCKLNADIHHITGAVNYLAFSLPRRKTILTVHDIGHFTQTLQGFRKHLYGHFFWRYPLKWIQHITAISEFTKMQLVEHFNINPQQVTVIPNPLNPIFKYHPPAIHRFSEDFTILQVGGGDNKNIEKLISAVKGLKLKLLLIRRPERELIMKLNASAIKYEFRYDLTESSLLTAYQESDILYFASTYEGFGLPIIEAMSVGRPVITSDISPMREVANGSASLVDPTNSYMIRDAIVEMMQSKDMYNRLIEKGLANIRQYDASLIASRYMSLYESVSGSN